MEQNEIEKKALKNTGDLSPTDRIDTPPPAQEIYPLQQSMNDGKQNSNENELPSKSKKEKD